MHKISTIGWLFIALFLGSGCRDIKSEYYGEGMPCGSGGPCADELVCVDGQCQLPQPAPQQGTDATALISAEDGGTAPLPPPPPPPPCQLGMRELCFSDDPNLINVGNCRAGEKICAADGWGPCEGEVLASDEEADGLDNDCDGEIDEDFSCIPGSTQPCGETAGQCKAGEQTCDASGQWGDCNGAVLPQDEVCDGEDNDCDGNVDDLPPKSCYPGPSGTKNVGQCKAGKKTCTNGTWSSCQGAVEPTAEIACDNKDNDCNGEIDEVLEVGPVVVDANRASDVSMTLDAAGKVHIAHKGGETHDFDLMYTTNASGAWKTRIVDAVGNTGYNTSIGVSPTGKVHISYKGMGDWALRYATNASGSWKTEDITVEKSLPGKTSLVVDKAGKVHISFHNAMSAYVAPEDDGWVYYVTNASGAWKMTPVDDAGFMTANETSLALDTSGKAHIAYRVYAKNGVWYATNASGTWKKTNIDTCSVYGLSLALDSDNKAHIAYRDNNATDLKYTTNASGSWVIDTIDASGSRPSIAIDSADNVHIGYRDNTNSILKYATNASAAWVIRPLDASYYSLEIAVDGSDRVHLAAGSNDNLGYIVPCP